MLIKQEKTFESRDDLDAYIRSTHGDNADKNKEITLEMPAEEMQKMLLSEKTTIFGVKIIKKLS